METPVIESASASSSPKNPHEKVNNVNHINSALAVSGQAEAVGASVRAYEIRGFDEFSHQLKRHRNDLQTVDGQMQKLDEAIEADQRRIQELTAALEEKFRARGRIQAVRVAMARFIDSLQAKDGK